MGIIIGIFILIVVLSILLYGLRKVDIDTNAEPILQKSEEIKSDCKYKDCDIEYVSGRGYYPRYKGRYPYIYRFIDQSPDLLYNRSNAKAFFTKWGAKRYLKRYLNYAEPKTQTIKLCPDV